MFHFILPKFIFNIERWKWNDEYRVYVSNMGHFKDEHKKPLPFKINRNGYISIQTNCGLRWAHRLVMLTWMPIPDAESLTVDHLDHNKRNNEISNLEWVTREENHKRALNDLDYLEQICKKEIVCIEENKHFDTVYEAAQWLLETKLSHDTTITKQTKDRVVKKINKAIKNKESYNGYRWIKKKVK